MRNIIQIYNIVMWDWQYSLQYCIIKIECGDILHNIISPI